MKKIVTLTIIILIILSCDKKNRSDDLCKTLISLNNKDQKYRNLMQDNFFSTLDSIVSASGYTKEEYANLSRETQLHFGKIAKRYSKQTDEVKRMNDSLMNLQIRLDNKNTEKLIKIVKKHGYPDMDSLSCQPQVSPFLIFGHSQSKYWKKIRSLIKTERKKGRISEGDYQYIMWHTNGRKGELEIN